MIVVRCDRCSAEHPYPRFFSSGSQMVGMVMPEGWEHFVGWRSYSYEGVRNKHICPKCAEEYHYGFLRTKPATENA